MPPPVSIAGRDVRILRAAREVLARYSFHPVSAEGPRRRIEVRGGVSPYVVTVHDAWGEEPHCTCPDAARQSGHGYCKHLIAVLLRDDVARCQLLELFLS
jgi:hypothetical protein